MKLREDGIGDIHLHTTASDGTCSVDDRLRQAKEHNLEVIAITDHDTIPETLDDRSKHIDNIQVITGVEVRAGVWNTKAELLGYYIEPTDDRLRSVLKEVREYRQNRNRRIIDRLNEVADLDVTYEEMKADTDGILGRPHIANVLVEQDLAGSIGAAFDRYLGAEGEAFVPMERIPAREAIEAIKGAGGVVSLAHPGRIRAANIEGILDDLISDGLDAIEVRYPYDDAPDEGYADVDVQDAAALAERFDLLWTGGSDCHGPGSEKFRIGNVRLRRDHLQAIREVANERRKL